MTPAIVLVTDPSFSADAIERVVVAAEHALPPGVLLVQVRDKSGDPAPLATRLRRVATHLAINAVRAPEHLDLAARIGADGVHVACDAAAIATARARFAWVSTPAHDDDDVDLACRAGASAVLVSPIWDSPGKGPPRGPDAIASARTRAGGMHVYALGGVDASRAATCRAAGAHGVAVIRALLDVPDVGAAARALWEPFA